MRYSKVILFLLGSFAVHVAVSCASAHGGADNVSADSGLADALLDALGLNDPSRDAKADSPPAPWTYETVTCSTPVSNGTYGEKLYPGRSKEDLSRVVVTNCRDEELFLSYSCTHPNDNGFDVFIRDGAIAVRCIVGSGAERGTYLLALPPL